MSITRDQLKVGLLIVAASVVLGVAAVKLGQSVTAGNAKGVVAPRP